MARNKKYHWRAFVGALAVAGLAFGLSLRLEGAAHVPGGVAGSVADPKITVPVEDMQRARQAAILQRAAESGEPAVYGNMANLMGGDVPIFPVIQVDYRDDEATRLREAGLLVGPLPTSSARQGEGGVAAGGCSFTIDCDDGDPCTVDSCDFEAGQPAGSGTCVHVDAADGSDGAGGNAQCPDNFGLNCGGCNDGVFCNGVETCQGGVCVAGTPPCSGLQVCSETFDMCQNQACTAPADCSNAGVVGQAFADVAALHCNGVETCSSGVCVAGTNPCGSGGLCGERRCSIAGNPNFPLVQNVFCITDEDCAEFPNTTCTVVGPACKEGRCCTGSVEPTCSRRFKFMGRCSGGVNPQAPCASNAHCAGGTCSQAGNAQSCDGVGGLFYGHDAGTIPQAGPINCPIINNVQVKCPKYSAGIAPAGPFLQLLGPISDSPIVRAPFGVPLEKLGDDYTLSNPGVCDGGTRNGLGCAVLADCPGGTACVIGGPSFIDLDYLRFAGGSPATDRISFEFYDEQGNFVEDLFFSGTAAFGIYPVLFNPPIKIPSRGFVVQRVAPGFSPSARHVWASTNATDVGTNNPNLMWVNNASVNSNFGTSGILAFELEGTKVTGSFGACCFTDPDVCVNATTPYECRGGGGAYLGNASLCATCDSGTNAGQYCRRCSNNTAQVCNEDSECGAGTCIPFNGACGGGGTCVAQALCTVGACCNPTTGDCSIESETDCDNAGGDYLGNGTDCDASNGGWGTLPGNLLGEAQCCPQPVNSYTGADDCEDVTLTVITAPPIGEIKIITITGDNSGATNSFGDPDSCFDPSDDPNADPGWWEGFTLVDDCTIIYVDHCCTDPVHRPAYRIMYDSCPCGTARFTAPNPYRFPEGADSRGLPYCAEDDNAWQCFGLLTPGTYYYPIYSALAGHHGQYQFHITALACPTAACCLGENCVDDVNQLECDAMGGYFQAPPQRSPAVLNCSGTNGDPGSTCYNGSCCTGPGACLDLVAGSAFTEADCDAQQGNFVGGVKCQGGTCSNNPLISCVENTECGAGNTCLGSAGQIAQPLPCPVCEFEGPGNCQPLHTDSLNLAISDRHLGETGILVADDFKPEDTTLSRVCIWGFYLDGDPDASQADCGPLVTSDSLRVRVFETDPATGRSPKPGPPLAESTASREKGIVSGTNVKTLLDCEVYGFQMTLDNPIAGLNTSQVYWLEVSNDVSATSLPTCNFFWMQQNPTSTSLSFNGSEDGYEPGFETPYDMSFCTNFNFTPSVVGASTGPCCTCDGACTLHTLNDCAANNGVWHITETLCAAVTCPVGAPAHDSCLSAIPIDVGQHIVNNQCATTDGFGPIPSDYDPVDGSQIDFDLWYTFVAESDCDLVVSECATGVRFDSMFAVYYNPDNPTECPPCPFDLQTSVDHLAGLGQDESCTGSAIGGPGIWRATDEIGRNAQKGECFLLRIGSFPGSRGTANLDISCGGGPGGEQPFPVVADAVNRTRFLSFRIPNNAGCTANGVPFSCCTGNGAGTCDTGEAAIRVRLTTLHNVVPPYGGSPSIPFTAFQGMSVYAGPPSVFVESGANPTQFYASQTRCTPHYQNWGTIGTLHLTGSHIAPSSVYHVEQLSAACTGVEGSAACLSGGGNVSAQTEIRTTRWGDIETPYNPPDPTVQPNASDIGAGVSKFRGVLTAPVKARALLTGTNAFGEVNITPDYNFAHIAAIVDAFRGLAYPFRMGKCANSTAACTSNSDCGANGPCNLYCPP